MVGRRAWRLPGWLDRHVPDLDVEGEQLMEQLEKDRPSEPERPPTEEALT
jgi:RND superfamily putative drug exporter